MSARAIHAGKTHEAASLRETLRELDRAAPGA
jgi:hypothetical protein